MWAIWDPQGVRGTLSGALCGPFGAIWGPQGVQGTLSGAIWGHLEAFGDIWGHLGPFGAIWDHLGQFVGHLGPLGRAGDPNLGGFDPLWARWAWTEPG